MKAKEADQPLQPEILCIGDICQNKAFYIHSNTWFGGDISELHLGRVKYAPKNECKNLFYRNDGKIPPRGINAAKKIAETVPLYGAGGRMTRRGDQASAPMPNECDRHQPRKESRPGCSVR